MNYLIQALSMPMFYLLIVGVEWLVWPARFNRIRDQIPLSLAALTIVSIGMAAAFWLSDNVSICRK